MVSIKIFEGSLMRHFVSCVLFLVSVAVASAAGQTQERARSRAENLVAALRNGDWRKAGRFVHLDGNTRSHMGIASDEGVKTARPKIEAWFRMMYGKVRPGQVVSVKIDPSEPKRALVSYTHEDLDGFHMHFVNGDWFYVLE
jgi:translation initiation factor IF-1